MSYSFMRIILFFDLPTLTMRDSKNYTQFRKALIKSGYLMLQESVYCKLVLNSTAALFAIDNVKKIKPENGLVQIITLTERQYAKMEYVVGEYVGEVVDSDERLVIL